MHTARYGRMRVGRCLSTSYFVGCYADVLPFMDDKCSGRQMCSMKILDTDLVKFQPCRKDLMAYMEASYICTPGGYSKSKAFLFMQARSQCVNGIFSKWWLSLWHLIFPLPKDLAVVCIGPSVSLWNGLLKSVHSKKSQLQENHVRMFHYGSRRWPRCFRLCFLFLSIGSCTLGFSLSDMKSENDTSRSKFQIPSLKRRGHPWPPYFTQKPVILVKSIHIDVIACSL